MTYDIHTTCIQKHITCMGLRPWPMAVLHQSIYGFTVCTGTRMWYTSAWLSRHNKKVLVFLRSPPPLRAPANKSAKGSKKLAFGLPIICASMYVSIYDSIYASSYAIICASVYSSTCANRYANISTCMCVSIYVSIYDSIYPSIYAKTYASLYGAVQHNTAQCNDTLNKSDFCKSWEPIQLPR